MSEATLEALKLSPLGAELKAITQIGSQAALLSAIAHLQKIGVATPFSVSVSQDMKQADRYIPTLHQSGLGLPDKDYYSSPDAHFAKTRTEYISHITKMLNLAAIPEAATVANQIFELEKKLAATHWSRVDNRDYDKTYNKYEITKLNSLTPHINWLVTLPSFGIENAKALIVYQPSTLTAFDKLLNEIPLEQWKNYLRWHLLSSYAPYLNKAFVDEHFNFYGKQLGGLKENLPRNKRGIHLVNGTVGDSLGKLYIQNYFSHEDKKDMDVLVANLKAAFKLSLENNHWMSEPTKKAALIKLSKITTKIGYPTKWKSYEGLVLSDTTLVQNIMNSSQYEFNRDIKKLGKPVDKTEWFMLPHTVNAYYSPNMNEIVFPAAILQPPLFDNKAPDAQNYGAIGAIIGHEISHGFDDQGRKFDGDGNLNNWWTDEDLKNFSQYTKRLVEQYAQYEPLKGSHINGELTLGENIADISGLSIAYRAFQISQKNNSSAAAQSTGDNKLTHNQLFFISWAQGWANKIRSEELQKRLITDPHSPGEYRADGTVKNIDAFYEAFNVQPTDKMYLQPKDRVNLWSFGSA